MSIPLLSAPSIAGLLPAPRSEPIPLPPPAYPQVTAGRPDTEPVFEYGNLLWLNIPAPTRRQLVPTMERLLDCVTNYANGCLSDTDLHTAFQNAYKGVVASLPMPAPSVPRQRPGYRGEPSPLHDIGLLPRPSPRRPVITQAACTVDGRAAQVKRESGPASAPYRSRSDELDELDKAAFDAGRKKAQEVYQQMMANRREWRH